MLVFPTIPHTGTHFICHLFGHKPEQGMDWSHDRRRGNGEFYFDHIDPRKQRFFMPLLKAPGHTIIVPLRHPAVAWKSWTLRNRGPRWQEFAGMWRIMAEEIDPLGAHYLPIDSPRRDEWLARLSAATGRTLVTDWTPRGSKAGTADNRYTRQCELSRELRALCEAIAPFLERFYDA